MSLTSSGALKSIVESAGLKLAAYRDAAPQEHSMPVVTIDENVTVTQERHGDTSDPAGHHGEAELVFVHLWELWRNPDGRAAEQPAVIRGLKRAIRTAPPFAYGPDDAPVRVYGMRIDGHARIVEEDDNVVHHTITVTLRRDA